MNRFALHNADFWISILHFEVYARVFDLQSYDEEGNPQEEDPSRRKGGNDHNGGRAHGAG